MTGGRDPKPAAPGAPVPCRAADLPALLLEPNWPGADPENRRLLTIDLTGAEALAADDVERIKAWLGRQPVPCIGVSDAPAGPLHGAVDLLAEPDELAAMVAGVQANPDAASILVEVLRSVGTLPPLAALTLESLGYATLQGGAEFARWLATERHSRPARSVLGRDDIVELQRDGTCLRIVLNSPETRNSLSAPLRDALSRAFEMVAVDGTIEQVEVTGRGPCFSAGGDLGEFGLAPDTTTAHRVRMLRMPARYLMERPEAYTFRLHGGCIGAGIELPAFAGHVSASDDAYFQLPELAMGLIPGAGGCVSVSRRIGRQRTARMVVLGERVSAPQALEWGLIDEIAR